MNPTNLHDRLDDALVSIRPDRDLVQAGRTAGARTLRRRRIAGAGLAAAALAAGAVAVPSLLAGSGADTTVVKDSQVATGSASPASPAPTAPDIRVALADDVVTSAEWADAQVRAMDYLLPDRFGSVTAVPLEAYPGGEDMDPVNYTLTTEAGSPRLEMFLGIQGPTGGHQPGETGCAGLRDAARNRGADLVEWTIVGCDDSDLGGGWRSMAAVEYSRLADEAQRVHGASILTFNDGVWSEAGFTPLDGEPLTITADELAAVSADPLWLDLIEVGTAYVRALPANLQAVVSPPLPVWPGAS